MSIDNMLFVSLVKKNRSIMKTSYAVCKVRAAFMVDDAFQPDINKTAGNDQLHLIAFLLQWNAEVDEMSKTPFLLQWNAEVDEMSKTQASFCIFLYFLSDKIQVMFRFAGIRIGKTIQPHSGVPNLGGYFPPPPPSPLPSPATLSNWKKLCYNPSVKLRKHSSIL